MGVEVRTRACVVLTAMLFWALPGSHAGAQEQAPPSAETGATPTRVRVAPLSEIAITLRRSVPATVTSLRTAVVASELSAQVTEMPVVPGDVVDAGAVLARLDCHDNTQALASARSQLTALRARQSLAQQQLDRLKPLLSSRSATEEQVNQRQAELDIVTAEIATQRIAIDVAERQVARCDIVAPFAGLVTTTPGQVGNYLTPGSPVVSLVDMDRVELKAELLEYQVAELATNRPLFEFGGRSWPLRVRTIFPVMDEVTQTREVRFEFTTGKPPPGAVGRLRWTLAGNTLPAAFVVERGGRAGVFSVSARGRNRATFLPLAGASSGQPVTTDLPDDLLVVTDGRFGLQPDQPIIAE